MSVLTADQDVDRKEAGLQSHPVTSGETMYKGALACIDGDGYLVAAADTADYKFAGVTYEKADNSGGGDAAKSCRVYTRGVFLLTCTGITQAMVGQLMYVKDDDVVDNSSTNWICVGRLVQYVSTTSGWVDIGDRAIEPTVTFMDDVELSFGNDQDIVIAWDGTNLNILPAADDTGAINIGDGTTDIDVKIFLGGAEIYVLFDRGNRKVWFGSLGDGVDIEIHAETDSYYVMWDQDGDGDKGVWYFGREHAYGVDVHFKSSVSGDHMIWDASAKQLQFVDVELCFDAAAQIQWSSPAGAAAVFWMYYDGSGLNLLASTDKGFQIGDDTNTIALKVYGFIGLWRTTDVGPTEGYMWYDTASNKIHFAGPGGAEQEVTSGGA